MNWGKGLVVSMSLFILFIIGLVFFMLRHNDALYEEDYYQKGEEHTETMKAEGIGGEIKIVYSAPQLTINLQEIGLVSSVTLKHMGNSAYDRQVTNDSPEEKQVFTLELKDLENGIWYVEINGKIQNKTFFRKEKLVI